MVERYVRDVEAGGSNPLTPTKKLTNELTNELTNKAKTLEIA